MTVSTSSIITAPPSVGGEVSLAVGGMTCGACAARVERALNDLDGVVARVNYATERASVVLPTEMSVGQLIDEVISAGYTAEVVGADPQPATAGAPELELRVRALRRRFFVAAVLFMPLCDLSIFFSIYPTLRFAGWQWLMVALAAPVVTWAAWPFYQAAVRSARHRTTTMDTLVSLGILAATGWSLYSMFFLDAGVHHSLLHGLAHRSGGGIYLDVPAGVTTFLLAGRYFEAWSRQRSGNALRALAAVDSNSSEGAIEAWHDFLARGERLDFYLGPLVADEEGVVGAQPHLIGVGIGHHLQQRHSIPISRRPVSVANSHIASRHSMRSRACARSAPHAVIPWPAMNSTGGASGCCLRCCSMSSAMPTTSVPRLVAPTRATRQ